MKHAGNRWAHTQVTLRRRIGPHARLLTWLNLAVRYNSASRSIHPSRSIPLRSVCVALGSLLLSSIALTAHAEPITFTETLTGSSYYGPSAGTTQLITITGIG